MNFDNAAAVDEQRRGTAGKLCHALLEGLPEAERARVLAIIARHAEQQREADARGESLPEPTW